MTKLIDLSGKRFGRLTVINRSSEIGDGRVRWKCRCDCGNDTFVAGCGLKTTVSCGCLRDEKIGSVRRTHGASKTKLYRVWKSMVERCHNTSSKGYKYYGARGITVCDRWKHSFPNFASDMGPRPEGLSLDRINNNGDYAPDNCRWATFSEQMCNRRPWPLRTHCRKGHAYTSENIYLYRGLRYCVLCRKSYKRLR